MGGKEETDRPDITFTQHGTHFEEHHYIVAPYPLTIFATTTVGISTITTTTTGGQFCAP